MPGTKEALSQSVRNVKRDRGKGMGRRAKASKSSTVFVQQILTEHLLCSRLGAGDLKGNKTVTALFLQKMNK